MYNSLYPININYRKPQKQYQTNASSSYATHSKEQDEFVKRNNQNETNTFPNGTKVAIDYSKGEINISQVLTDFRSTILAINAPDEIRDEVYLYLNLVEKESQKENPSKDIIISNLKNASKISDNYIAMTLKKPSNVVEGWIDALFLQRINLKSNPNDINPDFKLDFPQKAQERINNANLNQNNLAQNENEFKLDNIDSISQEVVFEQPVFEQPQSNEIAIQEIKVEADQE